MSPTLKTFARFAVLQAPLGASWNLIRTKTSGKDARDDAARGVVHGASPALSVSFRRLWASSWR